MKSLLLSLLIIASLAGGSARADAVSGHIAVSLLASTEQPRPGGTVLLGIRLVPDKGWHSYWSNPGESGLAPTVDWQAPSGLRFGPLLHPAPSLLNVMGITSYVHEGEHVLLSRVQVSRSMAPGTPLPIDAQVTWLACSASLCVPGRARLHLDLVAGSGRASSAAPLLEKAEQQLPKAAGKASFLIDGGKLVLELPAAIAVEAGKVAFFPDRNGILDPTAMQVKVMNGSTEILARADRDVPTSISGVVSDGRNAYRVSFQRSASLAASAKATPAANDHRQLQASPLVARKAAALGARPNRQPVQAVAPTGAVLTAAVVLVAALIGGLLLNLMPCVFPVLSLKAVTLARAGGSHKAARAEAAAYTAGSVISCSALGLTIFVLRLAGYEVGWSFQLQHPIVTVALLLLATALALNLAGLFELPGFSFGGAGSQSGSVGASFGAGALAAFVATPCSGPFMATALGATLLLAPSMSLLVYAALGFGLALPMLVVGFVPPVRRWLPSPGRWMLWFRRILAVPMILAAVALLWVLGRQSGTDGMAKGALLVGILVIALGSIGIRQRSGNSRNWLPAAPAAAAIGLVLLISPPASTAAPVQTQSGPARVEPFSEARLAKLQSAGVPVFVEFDADWCLTCKVNERLAIDRSATRDAFRAAGIVTLKGDWTNGDPAITRFLAAHGRNSIPFYLFYPMRAAPEVLPQLLTAAILERMAMAARQEKVARAG